MNKHSFGILPLRNSMVREKEPLYGLPYKKFIVGTDLGIALWDGQTESWGPVSGRHVEIDNNHFIYTNINSTVKKYDYNGNLIQTSAVIDTGTTAINAIAIIRGYVAGILHKENSTYATTWTGVFVVNPDGSIRWLNFDDNGPQSAGYLHNPDIKVDRQGYCYTLAYKGSYLYLQKWSIISGQKWEQIIGNQYEYTGTGRLAVDYTNNYIYVVATVQGSPTNLRVLKLDINTLQILSTSPGINSYNVGSGSILNCDMNGNVFLGDNAGNIFKLDPDLTSVNNFASLGTLIERVVPDILNNVFVLFDLGGNSYAHKYDKDLNHLFSVMQPGHANGLCIYPGNVSQLSPQQKASEPTNLFFQREGKYEGTLHWSYNDTVAGAFNLYVNNTLEISQVANHYAKVSNFKDGIANLISLQTDTLYNNRSNFVHKYIYGGFKGLEPETITYYDQVIAAGGQVNDIGWIDSIIKLCKDLGIYQNIAFSIGSNMGLKINSSNNVLNAYDIGPSFNIANGSNGWHKPVLQRISGINNKWGMYFNPGRMLFPNTEMMSSETFFIAKLLGTAAANYQVITNDDNTAQIRETEGGDLLNINGTNTLGSPSYSGNIKNWHIGQAILKKAATAQVGINGTFGAITNHTITSWILNAIGVRYTSEPFNGYINLILIFDTVLTSVQRNAIYNLINNYYGIV